MFERLTAARPMISGGTERARAIDNPSLTVARERYDRVAAAVGVECRDPFLDLRVVAFCTRLPYNLITADGWTKLILRRAMLGTQPDAVVWLDRPQITLGLGIHGRGDEDMRWDSVQSRRSRRR